MSANRPTIGNVSSTVPIDESPPRPHRTWEQFKASGYWLIPTLLSIPLIFRGITSRPLSHDEFYTLHAINEGLDQHYWELPLIPYYWLMQQWTIQGTYTSDLALRLPSGIAALVSVALVAITAKRVHSQRAGLSAGLLLAFSPVTQVFAHEARPYAIGAALFSLSSLLLVRALRGGSIGAWLIYGAVVLAGATVLPVGLVTVVGQALLVWYLRTSNKAFGFWLAALAVSIPAVLFHALLLPGFSERKAWAAQPGVLDIITGFTWTSSAGTAGGLLTGGSGLLIITLGLLSRDGRYWLGAATVGILALWVVSLGPTSFWSGKSAISLVALATVGAGISMAGFSRLASALIVVVAAALALEAFTATRQPRNFEPDLRQATAIISQNVDKSSVVIDRGSEYGIAAAVKQYSNQDDLVFNDTPTGPFWTVHQEPDCIVIERWDLGGDAYLRLCKPA
jgi:4-amino-4-deoxy-L-arabinose transferase-like glycosyltransferase